MSNQMSAMSDQLSAPSFTPRQLAYQAGRAAGLVGENQHSNPHTEDELWRSWESGWIVGKQTREGKS